MCLKPCSSPDSMVTSPSPTTQIGGIIGTTITTTTASESTRPVILVNSQDNGVRLVHALMACAEAVQTSNLMLAEALVKQIGFLAGSQAGAMRKVATYFAGTLARRIYRLLTQTQIGHSLSDTFQMRRHSPLPQVCSFHGEASHSGIPFSTNIYLIYPLNPATC
ncbi:hypothetical protein F2Q69_00012445 [Brassica cretica]|uniref:DELLA protein n=1 Tax=Brassica cretica TaxID=69181 RepID=A0A8S9QV92_BRACR|nr:hypothetical protein F2Q69_00012445 [Brassica cretica]